MSQLLDSLLDYERRGGRILFWSCPNQCQSYVDWRKESGRHIATCRQCGRTNRSTMSKMIAKFQINNVEPISFDGGKTVAQEKINLMAVSEKPFDAEGASEDNTFARYTPSGELSITVQNPALLGKFKVGEKYYLEFTKAE